MLKRYLIHCILFCFALSFFACDQSSNQILIIQDEMPQVVVLSEFLEQNSNYNVAVVDQDSLPADLSQFRAVLVFIHKVLKVETEKAVIDYTQKGGRLIVLHHSISSRKAENEFYFDFLGIRLDEPQNSRNPVLPNEGYGWIEPVTLTLVNLNPDHYITSHQVNWDETIDYTSSDMPSAPGQYKAILLDSSEAYLNHKFTDGREKTVLCGIKFFDERNQQLFMQDRGAWIKDSGAGKVIYFLPGHDVYDYQNKNMSQMILNAINWEK